MQTKHTIAFQQLDKIAQQKVPSLINGSIIGMYWCLKILKIYKLKICHVS